MTDQQKKRQQERTDRNLDWLIEWQEIANALTEITDHTFRASLHGANTAPHISLDGHVPLPNHLRDHVPYDAEYPSIGLTYTKGPERVAKDIKRRLLDDAEAFYQRVRKVYKKQVERDERKADAREQVDAETTFAFDNRSGSDPKIRLVGDLPSGYGTLEQSGPDSYRVDLGGISLSLAIRILKAIEEEQDQ